MKRIKLLALALAGVMTLALLTGCSDGKSKAELVEEYFRYVMHNQQKDEVLDKKLEIIAQKFQPDSWLDGEQKLTNEARDIIKAELSDYLVTGSVWFYYGEVKPGQSALTQEESMKYSAGIVYDTLDPDAQLLQAIAFTTTGRKNDGHRYYLALETYATINTPQN